MDWIYYLLLLVVQIAGLVITLFQFPGLWVMLIGTGVYMFVTRSHGYVSIWAFAVLFLLAVTAEVVEFLAGGAGAKKAGASKMGMAGAMLGGVVGAIAFTGLIPIPVVGTIVGACIGSFAGAMLIELYRKRDVGHSMRVGYGAAKGRLVGIAGKLTVGVIMLIVTVVVAFPAGGKHPTTLPSTVPIQPLTTLPVTAPSDGGL